VYIFKNSDHKQHLNPFFYLPPAENFRLWKKNDVSEMVIDNQLVRLLVTSGYFRFFPVISGFCGGSGNVAGP
jgi:hypothetical protein